MRRAAAALLFIVVAAAAVTPARVIQGRRAGEILV
jgi:hypothetical protein